MKDYAYLFKRKKRKDRLSMLAYLIVLIVLIVIAGILIRQDILNGII